jgi:hypothetical protein
MQVHTQSGALELTQEDSNRFKPFEDGVANLRAAIKTSRKRQKVAEVINDSEELDEDEYSLHY